MTKAFAVVFFAVMLAAMPVLGKGVDQTEARRLVERGEIQPLQAILEANRSEIVGRIVEIELERDHGTYVYEIKMLGPDGRSHALKVDARSAKIVRRK